jgi:hypothetical protein
MIINEIKILCIDTNDTYIFNNLDIPNIPNLHIHSKLLVSNDGKILLIRTNNKIGILSEYGYINLDNIIDCLKTTLITLKIIYLCDKKYYTIISWDNTLCCYSIIGIIICENENKQYITNKHRIKYILKDPDSKLSTNGYIYIYISKKLSLLKINDISYSLTIPIIHYICNDLLSRYNFNTPLCKTLIIGNMSRINKENLSNNLMKILTPLQEDNKFIIDTYSSIYVEILEYKKKLDVITIILYMIDNLSNIDIIFDKLKHDQHYLSKVYLILEYIMDIYTYICDYTIKDKNLELSKEYIKHVILYILTIYKLIKITDKKNENIISIISNNFLSRFTLN